MKRILILLILPFSLINYGNCQTSDFDFRKAKWGMSLTDVIQSEEGNPYEIDKKSANTYLRFYNVSLTRINGHAKVFYEFKNNSLVSVDMILYIENTNNYYNCKNPLSMYYRIDLMQRQYFNNLLSKGFLPAYRWQAGLKGLFSDDLIGKNPLLKTEEVIKAYDNLKAINGYDEQYIKFSFKSKRSSINFTFDIQKNNPNPALGNECDSEEWSEIASIHCYGNSDVLKNVTNPDF